MTEDHFKRIESMMARRIEVLEENVQHKFNLLAQVVIEGQQRLAACMDRMEATLREMDAPPPPVEGRQTRLEKKVDDVAAGCVPHLAGAEVNRGSYRLREE